MAEKDITLDVVSSLIEAYQKEIEELAKRTGKAAEVTPGVGLGDVIASPEEWAVMHGVAHSTDPDVDAGRNLEADKLVSAMKAGIDLGSVMALKILYAPQALRARAAGRTFAHFIYGDPASGKTLNSKLVNEALFGLHVVTSWMLANGMDKEDIKKAIGSAAKEVFKPYTQYLPAEMDWDKWSEDFIDSVKAYGESSEGKKLESVLAKVTSLDDLKNVLSVQRTAVVSAGGADGVGKVIDAVKNSPPWATVSDVFPSLDERDPGGFKDVIQKIGDPDAFGVAQLDWTENVMSDTLERLMEHYGVMVGRQRMGLQFDVNTSIAPIIQQSTNTWKQLPAEMQRVLLFERLGEALFFNKKGARDWLEKHLSIGADPGATKQASRSEVSALLDDFKRLAVGLFEGQVHGKTGEKIAGAAAVKRASALFGYMSSLAKMIKEGRMTDFIGKAGLSAKAAQEEGLSAQDAKIWSDPFKSELAKKYMGLLGVTELNEQQRDLLSRFINRFNEIHEKFGFDPSIVAPTDASRKLTDEEESLLDWYDTKKGDYEKAKELFGEDDELTQEALEQLQEIESKLKEKGIDPENFKPGVEQIENKNKLEAELTKEIEPDAKKIKEKIEQALQDEAFVDHMKNVSGELLQEEFDVNNAVKEKGKSVFGLGRRLNNTAFCEVVSTAEGTKPEEGVVEIDVGGTHKLRINVGELVSSRPFKQIWAAKVAAEKYLPPQEAKRFLRNIIFGMYGPSVMGHIVAVATDAYARKGASTVKGLLDIMGELGEKTSPEFKKSYGDEDYKHFVDTLKQLATHKDIDRLTSKDSIDSGIKELIDNLVNLDKGKPNEQVNKQLIGITKFLDMAHKFLNEKGLTNILMDAAGDDTVLGDRISQVLSAASELHEDAFTPNAPTDEMKEKLDKYRQDYVCANIDSVRGMTGNRNAANGGVSRYVLAVDGMRIKRLAGLAI